MTAPSTSARASLLAPLAAGWAWTAERLGVVDIDQLHRPTPCTEFDLGQLLDHLAVSLRRFIVALGSAVPDDAAGEPPTAHLGRLGAALLDAWARADLEATYELPIGRLPAEALVQLNLAEIVIHGWDVGRSTGEPADVPDELAEQVLHIGRTLLTDTNRSPAFGPARASGRTPSDRMVAFYGRQP
jgi:uncharacterized protein (TIGR03086 family)